MKVANRTNKILPYMTWYEFKKDLEKKSGHVLLNWQWLEVKPKAPLPWDGSHMKEALSVTLSYRHS